MDSPQEPINKHASEFLMSRAATVLCCDGSVSDSSYDIIREDLFVGVKHSCVVVKGRLREKIAFWQNIGASNWLLRVIREGYCLPSVELPEVKFFHSSRKFRRIVDLRYVNQHLRSCKFKYEDIRTAADFFQLGGWFFKFDLLR